MRLLHGWKGRALVLALVALLGTATDAQAQKCEPEDQRVVVDHSTGVVSPDGMLRLRGDEHFCIEVVTVQSSCILINLAEVPGPQRGARDTLKVIPFRVHHHEDVGSYKVSITKKGGSACKDVDVDGLEREIPVETYGWSLALAGAFTADELTDPVFFLESGEQPDPDDPESPVSGFFVRDRQSAEDDLELGAATFVHVYHNDPKWLGFAGVHWVPLSFGLGIGDSSQAKYYFGTGLRFGRRAFLTVGKSLGTRERLPDGLGVDDFTADQNALKSLPSQSTDAWFLSLSLRGLDVDLSHLSRPFKSDAPKPKEPAN